MLFHVKRTENSAQKQEDTPIATHYAAQREFDRCRAIG
jgi:hypothetical protein